ncbi:MAG: phosphoribosylamine--glycine ligase [Candidatus Electryoneaceae bacterium]|nr:phosphoribosylamine--glycine ligase [Candidatus Electryoneaceae bacterium]
MKILIIGSGGREHTLAWISARSPLKPKITCIPGNGGTDQIASNIDIDTGNLDLLVGYIREQQFDLTIIGPEVPLVSGLADKLTKYGLPVFGPTSGAAKIEGSKAFSKIIMKETEVPTAEFDIFTDINEASKYIRSRKTPILIKTSGLAAGKGAVICQNIDEAILTAKNMLSGDTFGDAGKEIVVEEFLTGPEMSLMAFVDGEDYLLLPPSRDHKKAFDGDQGPNTGGMGAYAPVDDLNNDQIEKIAEMIFPPILKKLSDLGTPYRGLLYPGLILTEDGPKVLEFNCRFGDPETQVVIPLLTVDPLRNNDGSSKRQSEKLDGVT